jgi:hypothetical protein
MSKNMWDEPFRDSPVEFSGGQWKDSETYTPAPETSLRPKPNLNVSQKEVEEMQQEDLEELTQQIAQEDEEDYTEVLSDARLRLEQGKLYEMILNHDLFNDVEADPRAAKSVQKQIRNWAKNQMEIMLGMRQEVSETNNIVSSPFNDLEVTILKKLASAASKGATETEEAQQTVPEPVKQKKTTFNSIGSSKPKIQAKPQPKPVAKRVEPIERSRPQPNPRQEKQPNVLTGKSLDQMNDTEKAEYLREVNERNQSRKQVIPENRVPMPDAATMEMLAMSQVSRATGGNSGMSALNGKLSSLVIAGVGKK